MSYCEQCAELERENAELARKFKVSEEIRIGEKKILIAEIGKRAKLFRVMSVLVDWNNGRSMDKSKIMDAFNRAEALVVKGGNGK